MLPRMVLGPGPGCEALIHSSEAPAPCGDGVLGFRDSAWNWAPEDHP